MMAESAVTDLTSTMPTAERRALYLRAGETDPDQPPGDDGRMDASGSRMQRVVAFRSEQVAAARTAADRSPLAP
jgi:hypothetical protein